MQFMIRLKEKVTKYNFQPLISVIIPTYNRDYTITRALHSVLKQTYKNMEILVVDDGSTDDTNEIVAKYSDKRIKYIRHEVNKGEVGARNTGIRNAIGKYIAWLDSDDEWLESKLEEQLNHMNKLTNSWKGVYCTCFIGRVKGKIEGTSYKGKFIVELLTGEADPGIGTSLLVEKKVFEEIGYYDSTLKRQSDVDWLIRYFKKFNLDVISVPLAIRHPGGCSNYNDVKNSFDYLSAKYKTMHINLPIKKQNKIKGYRELRLFELSVKAKNYKQAWVHLLRSLSISPISIFYRLNRYYKLIVRLIS